MLALFAAKIGCPTAVHRTVASIPPNRTETQAFKADVSFADSMNPLIALGQIYIGLGGVPRFLLLL